MKWNREFTDCKVVDGTEKVNTRYWYQFPILADYNSLSNSQIDIPDWCPRLNKNKNN